MSEVLAICSSERKGHMKKRQAMGRLVQSHGLEGDVHAGSWHRQLSLLAVDDIEEMRSRGFPDLQFGAFAENMVLGGLNFTELGVGSRLKIGDEAEVVITQIGKECHTACAIRRKVGDCIMPVRGLFGRVLKSGAVREGSVVEVLRRVDRNLYQAVVLTISDKGASGERVDTAGPAVAAALEALGSFHVYATEIIPDHQERIEERLRHYASGHSIDLVAAVGGTGFSPRDVTPEAVRAVADRLTPGLDEAMRAASMALTPRAMLSRSASGIRRRTLLLSLPGSATAAVENLQAILPSLPHGLAKLRGDDADCGTPVPDAPAETEQHTCGC